MARGDIVQCTAKAGKAPAIIDNPFPMFRTFFIGAIIVLAVVLAVASAWRERDPSSFRAVLAKAGASMPPGLDRLASRRAEAATAGLRKCRNAAGDLTYTNGACDAGSRQETIGAGSVSVVQGGMPAASVPVPNLMKALAGPDLGDLQQRRIDRAIGE